MGKSTEKGSVLISVLILVVIVVLIMGAVASFITGGIHRTKATSARLQALYLAEAGAEKAIEQLKENWDNIADSIGASDKWVDFPSGDEIDKVGQYSFEFPLGLQSATKRVVESSGAAAAGSEPVTVKVKISSLPKVMADGIFARNKIYLDGSVWIQGPVNTNSTTSGSVFLDWSTGIDGDVNVGPDGDPNAVITGHGEVLGQKDSLSEPYPIPPLPLFPEFPADLPHLEDFTAGWNPSPPHYITDDGEYNKLEVLSTLIINVGSGTRRIRVRELSVTGDGKIILEGTGKLEFYVDETFTIANSGGINVDSKNNVGDSSRVLLYYKGTNTMKFAGNVRFAGSVYAKTANLSIGGSGKIVGSFATGGTEVTISGGAWEYGILYAPDAKVTLTGSGSLEGTIVAKELTIDGGGSKKEPRVAFDSNLVETFPFSFSDFEIESWEQL